MSVGNTAAEAANLFVRLLVGSRTCFWLVLAFGYTLPPALEVPMDALHVGLMMWLKPSRPFCSVMQSAASMPLFRTIAHALPLVSLMPLGRPQLEPGADVCNPLVSWMMVRPGGGRLKMNARGGWVNARARGWAGGSDQWGDPWRRA